MSFTEQKKKSIGSLPIREIDIEKGVPRIYSGFKCNITRYTHTKMLNLDDRGYIQIIFALSRGHPRYKFKILSKFPV